MSDERDSDLNACQFKELCEAERSSAAEVAAILFPILGWKSGGIGAAADEVSRLLSAARGEASFHRERAEYLEKQTRQSESVGEALDTVFVHMDENGDPVGAQPETSWERGYAAGLRHVYRALKARGFVLPVAVSSSSVQKG